MAGRMDEKAMIRVIKEAFSSMKVELDDRKVGQFVEDTVYRAIYT
jgi:hypothetical protein